jgi:ATP-dependent DNA helicase RecG
MEIRGVGEFLGTNQRGVSELKIASLIEDKEILEQAREDAFALVEKDPHLQDPANKTLKPWYEAFCKQHHVVLRS